MRWTLGAAAQRRHRLDMIEVDDSSSRAYFLVLLQKPIMKKIPNKKSNEPSQRILPGGADSTNLLVVLILLI
jgi:hypothetical protein